MDEAVHLVCHDCPEEGVYGERARAEAVRERHAREAAHRVSLLTVASPANAPEAEPTA